MTTQNKAQNYSWVNTNTYQEPKNYLFIADTEIVISGFKQDKDNSFTIFPIQNDPSNEKALKKLDTYLYNTTINFFYEEYDENVIRICEKEEEETISFTKDETTAILNNLIQEGYLPKTSNNCGALFEILSLDAKLRSGEKIVDCKVKGRDITVTNALFVYDLVIKDRIKIETIKLQVGSYQIKCDSNDSFMEAMHCAEIKVLPDTNIRRQLKALKARADFIQAEIDLGFLSGSIKLDNTTFILFKDDMIHHIDATKNKKKVISPWDLCLYLNKPEFAPEIQFNPNALLKKGDNHVVTLKYNGKRHDLSTIDGIKNRVLQTLEGAYNKNLKKDVDKLTSLIRLINDTTEEIDSIMQPWNQVKQSSEVSVPDSQ